MFEASQGNRVRPQASLGSRERSDLETQVNLQLFLPYRRLALRLGADGSGSLSVPA